MFDAYQSALTLLMIRLVILDEAENTSVITSQLSKWPNSIAVPTDRKYYQLLTHKHKQVLI